MSSQADSGTGENTVVCYFPNLPYFLRYQMGFDIIINPPVAQADPSDAGESHRVIHVQLFFPDGFMCNPATLAAMPHSRAFGRGAPHFFNRRHHFYSSLYQDFPHLTPHFDHLFPPDFEGPMMWPEQRNGSVFVSVRNGQLGEFMAIDDTPYDFIRQCNICDEFHREPGHCQDQPSYFPRNTSSQKLNVQPEHSSQHLSSSEITGERDTPHTSPRAPHFSPVRPPFYPPMYSDSPYEKSHFDHHIPMGFEVHQVWEEQHHTRTRVFEVSRNGQPGEFTVNEDTQRFTIPQFNVDGEVPRQPGNIHDNSSENMPSQQPRRKPRHSRKHPSSSGIRGQRRTTSHASPHPPSEGVATDHRGHLQNEDESYLTKPTEGEIQVMLSDSVQEIQPKNHTATSAANQLVADCVTTLMNLLDAVEENEENVSKDNKKPSDDPNVNNNN